MMKKLLSLLSVMAVAVTLSMPVFAQETSSQGTATTQGTTKKHHKKHHKKSKKSKGTTEAPPQQ